MNPKRHVNTATRVWSRLTWRRPDFLGRTHLTPTRETPKGVVEPEGAINSEDVLRDIGVQEPVDKVATCSAESQKAEIGQTNEGANYDAKESGTQVDVHRGRVETGRGRRYGGAEQIRILKHGQEAER